MAFELVASDVLLLTQIKQIKKLLDGGFVRLYWNNLPPSPANVVSNFAEAYFAGYTPVPIVWGDPIKAQTGEYTLQAPEVIFRNTGSSSQTLIGWFYTTALGVLLSAPFTAPIALNPGGSLGVQVLATEWATFTLVG